MSDAAGGSVGRLDLDCRGLPCPRPIIELARALPTVAVGEIVAVASDDPAAANDVAAFCRMRGHEHVGTETAPDGVPVHLVRRLS